MAGSNVVTFSYATWAAIFPDLSASVNSAQAQEYFNLATAYCDNSACSPIPATPRATILNMLVSHLAVLLGTINGQPASPLVGRIATAAQGSVNVSVELDGVPGSAAWFSQTKFGLAAWQAMAPYRVGFYAPPPQVPVSEQSYPFFIGRIS